MTGFLDENHWNLPMGTKTNSHITRDKGLITLSVSFEQHSVSFTCGDESEFTYHQRQGFDNAFGVLRTALGILYLWGRKRIHISPETRV